MLICAWHQKYFPKEKVKIIKRKDTVTQSHGICKKCLKMFYSENEKVKDVKVF